MAYDSVDEKRTVVFYKNKKTLAPLTHHFILYGANTVEDNSVINKSSLRH